MTASNCGSAALFNGLYLELFTRTKREGWNVWGNQLATFAA